MKKILFFLPPSKLMRISAGLFISLFVMVVCVSAQAPPIQWQKCLGGSSGDWASSIQLTSDAGYIVVGGTGSNDGDVSGNHGGGDIRVVKQTATGAIHWQKCLGGSSTDYGTSIQQSTDGGYIVAGVSISNDGDVSGNHGNDDIWVVKLSSTGTIEWQKCLGGSNGEFASFIQQTSDGGYIVAGWTSSNNGDVSGNHGGSDTWVVKLSSTGVIQWQKCLGGSFGETGASIQQLTDGGYIVAGVTSSNDGDVSGNHGGSDTWVVKLASTGIIEWRKCLGGSSIDYGASIQRSMDGGYIVAGATTSNDGDVFGNHGNDDIWVVKLSSTGIIEWQKCLGGSDPEGGYSIQSTTDGGYIVAGDTRSNDGDVSGNHGGWDTWVVKLSSTGMIEWQKCLGGSADEYGSSVQPTTNGSYIVSGYTNSNDGDVSGWHPGYDEDGNPLYDSWVVKLAFNPLPIKLTSISARNRVNVNMINWSSASEDHGEHYELQRGADGVWFSAIASLPGNGRAADYEYTDIDPIPGVNYYRLLLISNDGNNTFSKIVSAFVKTAIELRLSPNPANEVLNIQIRGSVGKASLQITDVTGKTVLMNNLINNESKKINTSMLVPGVYFLRYRDDQHEIVKKFVLN